MAITMKKTVLILLISCGLSACGVKPGQVDPPDDVKSKEFPRTYPDLITNPPPYVPPSH
jgi:hypothetical protein